MAYKIEINSNEKFKNVSDNELILLFKDKKQENKKEIELEMLKRAEPAYDLLTNFLKSYFPYMEDEIEDFVLYLIIKSFTKIYGITQYRFTKLILRNSIYILSKEIKGVLGVDWKYFLSTVNFSDPTIKPFKSFLHNTYSSSLDTYLYESIPLSSVKTNNESKEISELIEFDDYFLKDDEDDMEIRTDDYVEKICILKDLREKILLLLEKESKRDREIFLMRFPLDGNCTYTQDEVADLNNISKTRVQQIERRIILKIKRRYFSR